MTAATIGKNFPIASNLQACGLGALNCLLGRANKMNSLIEQAIACLPESVDSSENVRQLAELVDSDLPLQSFLELLLPRLCSLYNAPAAVAWMKTQEAVFGVRYRMDALLSTITQQKRHERLVQFAWHHKQPMLVEPTDRTQMKLDAGASESNNPTAHRLLFAPILHLAEPIALLEVVLPNQTGVLPSETKQVYLRSAQLIAERVYGGLRRRMAMPPAQINRAEGELEKLSADLQMLQLQVQRTIEARLAQFQGWSFGSLAENQEFAKMVHQILESHGLRVACPECGHPAILRCLRAGNAKNGVFVFDHYLDSGRTFHGGPTTVPLLKIVAKPARRVSST
jgi:hypothetical protein